MKTKLQECVDSLNKKDRQGLVKQISQISAARKEPKHRLLQFLLQENDQQTQTRTEREQMHQMCFPKATVFVDVKLRHAESAALSLIEDFFIRERLAEDKITAGLLLLESFGKRGLNKHFKQLEQKLQRQFARIKERKPEHYHAEYQFRQICNRFIDQQSVRFEDLQIGEAIASIDRYYLARKLKLSNELLNLQQVASLDYPNPFSEQLIQQLPESAYTEEPLLQLHYLVNLSLTEPEEEQHFSALKTALQTAHLHVSREEVRDIYLFAFNYCTRKINRAHAKYFTELFELYKLSLESDIILENGVLSPWNYKNIVTVALRLQEYDWVYEFIHRYRAKLDLKESDNAYHFNLATYYFHIKDWDKVLQLLQKVSFSDIFYGLDTRTLQLKIYFEQQEWESLYAMIDSFRKVLRRKKIISDYHRENYLNLIKYIRQLAKANPRDRKKHERLQKQVEDDNRIADKNWLKEKIAERLT